MSKIKDDYNKLVSFWNESFVINDEDKKHIMKDTSDDYRKLSPSLKQLEALRLFNGKNVVLDYGCGSGWASIIMAKSGAKRIDAVDVSLNSIEMVNCYKEAYDVSKIINAIHINEKWLKEQEGNKYDGFFSSNVVDVIPLTMALDIIKEAARITKEGALVVFSLNFYIEPSIMKERGCLIDGPHIYINDVLRLTALTDQEWMDIFSKYFKNIKLQYYAWSGEEKERRRLFIMEK